MDVDLQDERYLGTYGAHRALIEWAVSRMDGNVEPDSAWGVAGWLRSLDLPHVVATALQPPLGVEPFTFVQKLSRSDLDSHLAKAQLAGLAEYVWAAVQALRDQQASTAVALSAKFATEGEANFQMELGSLSTYFGGLKGLIAPPGDGERVAAEIDAVGALRLSGKPSAIQNFQRHYSLLTTHYSLLTTHYLLLATHYSLLTTYYSLLTTHYSLFTTHYSLLSTYYSPLTTHYSILNTHYLLPTTHYSLFTAFTDFTDFTEMGAVGAARTVRSVPGSMEKTSIQAAITGTIIMTIVMMIVGARTPSDERLTVWRAGQPMVTYDFTT